MDTEHPEKSVDGLLSFRDLIDADQGIRHDFFKKNPASLRNCKVVKIE